MVALLRRGKHDDARQTEEVEFFGKPLQAANAENHSASEHLADEFHRITSRERITSNTASGSLFQPLDSGNAQRVRKDPRLFPITRGSLLYPLPSQLFCRSAMYLQHTGHILRRTPTIPAHRGDTK